MRSCGDCRRDISERFRFCPWCGAAQRVKLVEYFKPHPLVGDDPGLGLRVSRYLAGPRHVRLSIWRNERAEAAVSLDEDEAARLGAFLAPSPARRGRPQLAGLREAVRTLAGEPSRRR